MKRIEVVAAIIRRGEQIFATQRGYGDWKDWWEFPGGKMEPGETPREALKREIREELDAQIDVGRLLETIEWDYPAFHLTLHCFLCTLQGEALHLNEHEAARWLAYPELRAVHWLPADEGLQPLLAAELLGTDATLAAFLETSVIPRYAAFDKAHQEDHARAVVNRALALASHYPVDRNMVYAAAACHDLGLAVDRKTHHLESGRMIREMEELHRWFSPEQIETIAQAAEDHRASSDHAPRSLYGRIIAEADRLIEPEQIIRRTVQYGLAHNPELSRPGHWQRTLDHLHEKYAEGGYLKLWIPESPNAGKLAELRAMIRDEAALRTLFNRFYREEVLGPLVCERYRTDAHYREGHIHIIAPVPGTEILGLHTPEMKSVARTIARRNDLEDILDDWAADLQLSHDERLIWGLTLDYMKCPPETRIRRIRQLLPRLDNWAQCDTFCCNAKWVRGDEVRPFILECIASGQPEFTRRTGLLFLMCHFLDGEHLQRTFRDLESMELQAGEPYYVQMGTAWLLATALAKHPEETRRFVRGSKLPADIIRLYVRKARESRITRDTEAL